MITINSQLSPNTIKFLQHYNKSLTAADKIESQGRALMQAIGKGAIPLQVQLILTYSTFSTKHVKQNFKVSCQRWYHTVYPGYALVIKGNNVEPYTLASDEDTNNKGRVVKVQSVADQVISEEKRAEDKANNAALLKESDKNRIAAETATTGKKLAEANEARAIKNIQKKETDNRKLKGQLKDSKGREADLKKQVARLKRETSVTNQLFKDLVAMIKDESIDREQLIAKVA